ncbi:MAG: MFS transporter [Halopseudomonas sp.]
MADLKQRSQQNLQDNKSSPWAPFAFPAFSVLWAATVVSNIGTLMSEVGTSWLMTSLSSDPLMVALVQSATALPMFLFALPAGAFADRIDRRRMLLKAQLLMSFLALILTIMVINELMTPALLLLFTFLLGTCAAFTAPAWQSIITSLVSKDTLTAAVAMNSIGINVSRAIGPALAGFVIISFGIGAPFVLNTISFICVIAALLWWKPATKAKTELPPEHLLDSIFTGARHAFYSPALKNTLVRAFCFFICGSAFWALLPLYVLEIGGEATLYGILLGAIGAGAVGGAIVLQPVRAKLGANRLVAASSIGLAIIVTLTAIFARPATTILACVLYGTGWIWVLSSLNVAAQLALPEWIRARGLAIYLAVFFGSMSLGSAIWGQVASMTNIPTAMITSSILMLLLIVASQKYSLSKETQYDHAPSMQWPAPLVSSDVDAEKGPVLSMIEYRIAESNQEEFLSDIEELGQTRMRLGAYQWGVTRDLSDQEHFIEYFFETSWVQHLRHHEHMSNSDREIQLKVYRHLKISTKPEVKHMINARLPTH